jgi:O-antigen/teichoic acid export membrane protein
VFNEVKKISLNGIIYLITAVFSKGLNILLLPIYAKYLTVEEYGEVSLLLLFKAILVSILGFGQVVTIKKTYYEYQREKKNFLTFFSTIVIGTLFLDIFLVVLFFFFGDIIFKYFLDGLSFFDVGIYVLLSVLVYIPYQLYLKLCQTRNESIRFSILEISYMLIDSLLSLFLIIIWGMGTLGKVLGMFLSSLLLLLFVFPLIKKEINFKFDTRVFKRTMIVGVPIIPHSLSGLILNLSDRIFLNKKYNLEVVGLYSLAYQIGQIIDIISLSFIEAWSTFFMENANKGDKKEIISKFALYYVAFTSIISLFFSIFSKEIIVLFFDERYLSAYTVIPLIALGYSLKNIYYISNQQLILKEKTNLLLLSTGIAAIINLVLNYIMIYALDWEMIGAAVSTIISLAIMSGISYVNGQRAFYIPYYKGDILVIFFILFISANSVYVYDYFSINSIALKIVIFILSISLILFITLKRDYKKIFRFIINKYFSYGKGE